MEDDRREKVLRYEHFLNETLRSDLKKALEQRDKVYSDISNYFHLRNVIEGIQESNLHEDTLKTKVDLGCNFYVKAKVDDPSRIFISIGYGFFLEMTLNEALKFIDKKTNHLQLKCDNLTENVNTIKAHIKLVLEGLRELQNISGISEKEYRDILQ